MYDVLEQSEDIAENNLHEKTKKKIHKSLMEVLKRKDKDHEEFALGYQKTIAPLEVLETKTGNRYVQTVKSSWWWLEEFTTERKSVFYVLLFLFLIYIINTLVSTGAFIQIILNHQFYLLQDTYKTQFEWVMVIGQFTFQTISALVMVRGMYFLVRRKRLKALKLLRNGLAINILITHILTFYFQQFAATAGLLVTIGLFAIIHNIYEDERS
jgi:hypothetical protein